jgi:predicted nucleotidyltransferase
MIEENKKKRTLRGILGMPIGGVLFNSPQINDYNGGDSEFGDGGGVDEMISVVKEMHKRVGKKYEIYDIEEGGLPTQIFEPNMNDKQVGSFPANNNEEKDVTLNKPTKGDVKKYKVHVKNPETGKIVKVNFGDPNMSIKRDNPERKKSFRARHKCDTANDKTTPRYWSCKFWSNTPVKNLLSEIIKPDEVDVSALKFNDELNPLIWDEEEIKPEVRDMLLKIAIEFIKSCKLDAYKYKDIVFVGSMANFTYTPQSDIDLHIIVDFNQFKIDDEMLGEFFDAKKVLWLENHDIRIKGHVVECYVQNSQEPYTSLGVYSLVKNEWIRKPVKKFITVDEGDIQLKAAAFMNAIDKLETRLKNGEDVVVDLQKVKERIKNMRKNGLYKEGEYSTENLVFKILRNSGYLEKIINLKNNNMDQNLSL